MAADVLPEPVTASKPTENALISEHGIIDPDDELNPNDNDETSDEETDVSGVLSVGLDQSDDERKDEDE